MKKLLFLFLFLISLFSCEKEEATCWECSIFKTYETIWIGYNYSEKDYSFETEVICEHTEKEIRVFEDNKTYISDTTYYYHYSVKKGLVSKSTCYCIK